MTPDLFVSSVASGQHYPTDTTTVTVQLNNGTKVKASLTGSSLVASLKKAIPGITNMVTPCPLYNKNVGVKCEMSYPRELTSLIIHLNDFHAMSRNWIADWLETLDFNLSFKTGGGEHDKFS